MGGGKRCVVLTHDQNTLVAYAKSRIHRGERMPGVVVVSQGLPLGVAMDNIVLLAECSLESEIEDQVRYLPLR
jgi:hypothetical protein